MIADDDRRVRDDFQALLSLEDDMTVLAVAEDGDQAVRIGTRLRPDVIVMDVRMPVRDGIEATRALRGDHTDDCRVLIVTTFDIDAYVLGAIRAGASGFLLKDQAPEGLAAAVRIVASGEAIVSPRATARLLDELVDPRNAEAAHAGTVERLTPREVEVVRLLSRGLSNEAIAAEAFISRATVKTHVSSVLAKLGLTSRIQIVVWAHEHGLVPRR